MFRAGCRCFAPPHERVPENIQSDILPKVNISRLTLRKPLTITHGSQLLQKKKKKKKNPGKCWSWWKAAEGCSFFGGRLIWGGQWQRLTLTLSFLVFHTSAHWGVVKWGNFNLTAMLWGLLNASRHHVVFRICLMHSLCWKKNLVNGYWAPVRSARGIQDLEMSSSATHLWSRYLPSALLCLRGPAREHCSQTSFWEVLSPTSRERKHWALFTSMSTTQPGKCLVYRTHQRQGK